MLRDPFACQRDMPLDDALKEALHKHFPVYPVVDGEGAPGRAWCAARTLFANRAIEISAPGRVDGRRREGGAARHAVCRSLRLRHPWLQINLLTAFVAAAVVGVFEDTLSRLVILAVFLPVMAGQTGNTGCQALAVTLRGMTLGDVKPGAEAQPGAQGRHCSASVNGALVGHHRRARHVSSMPTCRARRSRSGSASWCSSR